MKIVNAMFGEKLGGLEQVFVDYSEALAGRGHALVNFVSPAAAVTPALAALGQRVRAIANFNQYDPIAKFRLRRALMAEKPDVAIAQGNRAINLMRPAARGVAPLVAVNHGVKLERTVGADFAIAINDDMQRRLIEAGQPPERVFKLFNMVRQPARLPRPVPLRSPPMISAMGRFVPKKGFDVFLDALAILKGRRIRFRAMLAGEGELGEALAERAAARGLVEHLTFPGWITDKAAFFEQTDIFCFPSSHDVCPVVLLEAFIAAKPVVIADCPGPREISEDGVDSLLFPIGDAPALAERIERLIANPLLATRMAVAAQWKILENHTLEKAGARLEQICRAASLAEWAA